MGNGLLGINEDPITLGLLQAASALATPQRQGGGFGPAMMAFPQALSQASAAKRQRESDERLRQADEMQRELFGMKRTGFEDDRAERARQRAAAEQQQQYLQSVIATLPPNQQALARAYPAEFIKTLMPQGPQKPTVVPQGAVAIDGDGRELFRAPKPRETRNVDAGSEILVIDTQTQEVVQRIPKSVSPDARYRTDNPALVPVEGPGGFGGYNSRTNTITPVGSPPGMPAGAPSMPAQGMPPQSAAPAGQPAGPPPFVGAKQAEAVKETAARDMRQKGQLDRANLVITKLDDAIGKVKAGFGTTGLPGSILGKVPGTDAYDLRRDVDTVIANIGFAELQAMREASPTGGALGQVAVQELNMLQAVLSSLDPNQSEAQLQKQLMAVKTHYTNWRNAVRQSRGEQPDSNDSSGAVNDPLGLRK
jgi:hypothetical protein